MRKLFFLAALVAALATPARGALTTTNSVVTYTSNGVTTAFATGYRFFDISHLVVQKTDLSAVTTTLVLGTDYSVTGANAAAGGTVTLVVAIPNAWTLKIKRSTPRTQSCTLRNQPVLAPKTVEDCLDRIVMIEQEMNDGTFAQLLVTPVTTSQASMAAPIAIPNAGNTNAAGSSSSFAAADHVHQCTAGSGTQLGCITTGAQAIAGVKTFSSDPVFSSGSTVVTTGVQSFSGAKTFSSATTFSSGATIGTSGTAISGSFRGTATWNPGTLGACGAGPCITATTNVTVTGAATGADCVAGVASPAPLSGYPVQCIVTATNTCGLMIVNQSNVSVTFGSATFYCRVFNP